MHLHPHWHGTDTDTRTELDIMGTHHTRRICTLAARLIFGWDRPAVRAWAARLIWGDAPVLRVMVPAGAWAIR